MSRPLPRYTDHRAHDERKLARILLETGASVPENPTTVTSATLPGDTRRLRGIPVCARNVAGVSPGTNPEVVINRLTPSDTVRYPAN